MKRLLFLALLLSMSTVAHFQAASFNVQANTFPEWNQKLIKELNDVQRLLGNTQDVSSFSNKTNQKVITGDLSDKINNLKTPFINLLAAQAPFTTEEQVANLAIEAHQGLTFLMQYLAGITENQELSNKLKMALSGPKVQTPIPEEPIETLDLPETVLPEEITTIEETIEPIEETLDQAETPIETEEAIPEEPAEIPATEEPIEQVEEVFEPVTPAEDVFEPIEEPEEVEEVIPEEPFELPAEERPIEEESAELVEEETEELEETPEIEEPTDLPVEEEIVPPTEMPI